MRLFRAIICIITLTESVRAVTFSGGTMVTNPTCNVNNRVRGLVRNEKASLSRKGNTRSLKKSKGTKYNSRKVVETTDLGSLTLDYWDWAFCEGVIGMEETLENLKCPTQDGVPDGWIFLAGEDLDFPATTRKCTIENDRSILLPVFFGLFWGEDVDCEGLDLNEKQCADAVKASCDMYMSDDVIATAASLNGSPVALHSITTPVIRKFKSGLCKNSGLEGLEFVYGCGYWLVLPPLCTCTDDEPYELYTNFTAVEDAEYAYSVKHIITVTGD